MKYFDAGLAMKKKLVRLVSFGPTLRSKLEDIRKSGGGEALQN